MAMMEQNSLGEIITRFLPELLKVRGVTKSQFKVLNAIAHCRTSQLGGSALACGSCGCMHYVFNSCRNRHCPRCQGIDKELWIEKVKQDLLPVKYYHVVFTVPHELLELFRFNRETMYNLLFEKAWETLSHFANTKKYLGATPGAIAILHTWDQQLKYHPHIHMIVPAGGIDENRQWKNTKNNGDFLFDVKQMSSKFSGCFVAKLRKLKKKGRLKKFVPLDLIKKPWVVYAISNARILKVTETHVTYRWCNRKENYKTETETITGVEFLKRFLEHIVPPYFRRIRHLGFLSSRSKKESLLAIRNFLNVKHKVVATLTRAQILELRHKEHSLLQCKGCGGILELLKTYPKNRAPPPNAA